MSYDALRISTTHRRRARSAFVFAIASTLLRPFAGSAPAPPAAAPGAAQNLADLVDAVAEAVVSTLRPPRFGQGRYSGFAEGHTLRRDVRRVLPQSSHRSPAARARKAQSLGSGFVINASGIVIIGDTNDIVVRRKLKANVIGKDPKVDVAVLKVQSDTPLKTVKFGDSDKMHVGDGAIRSAWARP